jgi:hypothetical protein
MSKRKILIDSKLELTCHVEETTEVRREIVTQPTEQYNTDVCTIKDKTVTLSKADHIMRTTFLVTYDMIDFAFVIKNFAHSKGKWADDVHTYNILHVLLENRGSLCIHYQYRQNEYGNPAVPNYVTGRIPPHSFVFFGLCHPIAADAASDPEIEFILPAVHEEPFAIVVSVIGKGREISYE